METPEKPTALPVQASRQLRQCRRVAWLSPVAAGAVTLFFFTPIMGPRSGTDEFFFWLNGTLGMAASVVAVAVLHPEPDPDRRFWIQVGHLIVAPVVYVGSMAAIMVAGVATVV